MPHTLEVENDRFLLERFKFCREESSDVGAKVILSRVFIEKYQPEMAMGNHTVITSIKCENFMYGALKIAHFPIRSVVQVCSKCFVGWLSSETKGEKEKYESGHWKTIFDILKKNQSLTLLELQNLCALYGIWHGEKDRPAVGTLVERPIHMNRKITLRYSNRSDVNYTENVLEHALDLARRYAQLDLEHEREKKELLAIYREALLQILKKGEYQPAVLRGKDAAFYIKEIGSLELTETEKIRLYNLLAVYLYQQKQFEEVLPLLQQALSLSGDKEETLRNLGSFLYAFGERKLAAVYFSQMREKDAEILTYLKHCRQEQDG